MTHLLLITLIYYYVEKSQLFVHIFSFEVEICPNFTSFFIIGLLIAHLITH